MVTPLTLAIAALLTLVPAALSPLRPQAAGERGRDGVFWLLLAVATVGPITLDVAISGGAWRTGFSASLWTIVAATMVVYAVACILVREAWRLTGLLLPYLVLLGAFALLWSSAPARPLAGSIPPAWLDAHITVSLLTYALLTIAAVAALAVWLKEWALRRHRTSHWLSVLPAVADAEAIQVRLLALAEIVLGIGLVTGMAAQYYASGALVVLDHKTVLSFAAFAMIAILLVLHATSGLRGRRAARLALVAYLLITLAFPGVKFVTDVIMG